MSTWGRASPAGLPLTPELLRNPSTEVGSPGHRVQQEALGAGLCSWALG